MARRPLRRSRLSATIAPPHCRTVLGRLRDARLHVIGAEEEFRALKPGSLQHPSWAFLRQMREFGHDVAERWLEADLASVGVRSTVDLSDLAGPVLEPHLGMQGLGAA